MIESGAVVELLNNGSAKVQFSASEDCVKCGICARSGEHAFVVVKNDIGAKVGDKVKVEIPAKKVLQSAFLIFILPLILMMAGYFIGGIIFSFGFLILAFLFLFIIDKILRKPAVPFSLKIS